MNTSGVPDSTPVACISPPPSATSTPNYIYPMLADAPGVNQSLVLMPRRPNRTSSLKRGRTAVDWPLERHWRSAQPASAWGALTASLSSLSQLARHRRSAPGSVLAHASVVGHADHVRLDPVNSGESFTGNSGSFAEYRVSA